MTTSSESAVAVLQTADGSAMLQSQRGNADAASSKVAMRSNSPIPTLELMRGRFALYAVVGAAVVILLGWCVHGDGVTLMTGVEDRAGSSTNAEEWVDHFQTANGYLLSFVEEASETYFEVLLAGYVTFFVNRRWSKKDTLTSTAPATRYKEHFITWFPPILMYSINVGFTSLFVDHVITDTHRGLVRQDLVFSALAGINKSSVGIDDTILHGSIAKHVEPFNIPSHPKCSGVMDEAVQVNGKKIDLLSSFQDIGKTSVVYGFQSRNWNYDAIPTAVEPAASVKVKMSDIEKAGDKADSAKDLVTFMRKSGFTFNTGYELLYQGTLMYERAIADASLASVPCTGDISLADESDGDNGEESVEPTPGSHSVTTGTTATNTPSPSPSRSTSAPRRLLQLENQYPTYYDDSGLLFYDKQGTLYNAFGNAIGPVQPGMALAVVESDWGLTVDAQTGKLLDSRGYPVSNYDGLVIDEPDDVDVGSTDDEICRGGQTQLEELNGYEQAANQTVQQLMSKTFDLVSKEAWLGTKSSKSEMVVKFDRIVLGAFVNVTSMTIDIPLDANYTFHEPALECKTPAQKKACSVSNGTYPFAFPNLMCNAESCVFLDRTKFVNVRSELQMMPYMKNFSSPLHYDRNLFMMLPSNESTVDDAAFLYGYGTYVTGDEFVRESGNGIPYIKNMRRHVVITFAKLPVLT